VYLVVLHIKRNRQPIEFFKMIRTKPVALDLLISYCKQQDLELLKDLYYQLEQPQETANIAVLEAYQSSSNNNNAPDVERQLQEAYQLYMQSKDTFSAKVTYLETFATLTRYLGYRRANQINASTKGAGINS
jgi:hypothetical protein